MNHEDKQNLRALRDEIEDADDKKLLRKTINYIEGIEGKLTTVRTLLRTALNETNTKGE